MTNEPLSDRARQWASTMGGFVGNDGVTVAHVDSRARVAARSSRSRLQREEQLDAHLAPTATRSTGGGNRARPEEPDDFRTAFERDRDRILHSSSFRRLAGKTQVFIFPDDHMRTRLTHALEVAQVATGIARPLGLNVALTEAIALGHDCGHGPGGHASEDAFDPYVDGGFDHAVWGADVSLTGLNLCVETLDGIRNHSWRRPAPATPEGEVVSWADRIAYVCHDFEDAVSASLLSVDDLPALVRQHCGAKRGQQLGSFINSVIATADDTGVIGMDGVHAEALAAFRAFNYEAIYLRDASRQQAASVVSMLRSLVDFFAAHPSAIPDGRVTGEGAGDPVHDAVAYVAGMTDRFACRSAVTFLGWSDDQLPNGIDR